VTTVVAVGQTGGAIVDTRITLIPGRPKPTSFTAPRCMTLRDCPCCRRARWAHFGMCIYAGALGGLWLSAASVPAWALVPAILAVGFTGGAVSWLSCTLEGMTAPKYWSQ
jgi:hypothetical protein